MDENSQAIINQLPETGSVEYTSLFQQVSTARPGAMQKAFHRLRRAGAVHVKLGAYDATTNTMPMLVSRQPFPVEG